MCCVAILVHLAFRRKKDYNFYKSEVLISEKNKKVLYFLIFMNIPFHRYK